jgi:hypothetical protein
VINSDNVGGHPSYLILPSSSFLSGWIVPKIALMIS